MSTGHAVLATDASFAAGILFRPDPPGLPLVDDSPWRAPVGIGGGPASRFALDRFTREAQAVAGATGIPSSATVTKPLVV